MKSQATRDAYGQALEFLGEKYQNMLVYDADLSESTRTSKFAAKFPSRFFNAGIAEQNMLSMAAGAAATGKIVFASSFAMFAVGRAYEQIRNSIGYTNLNVKIAASHAGLSVGDDGATHQCNEDIALMRTIPGMTIINPADGIEAYQAIIAAADYHGPVFIRLGRLAVPIMYDDNYKFAWGKGVNLKDGRDVAIFATGLMVPRALQAAEILNNEGISARVVNIHTIKPIDREIIVDAAKNCGAIVTAEEHSIIGGLGSAVAEVVGETVPVPVLRVGVEDVFGQSGPALDVLEHFGLTAENIALKAKSAINLKNK